jgi:MFS family permease
MQNPNRPTGMFGFTLVWLGQIVSVLATNMTAFALTIWVFEKTGSATALGLMQVFFITPFLIITPFAGVMVDRHNRKLMMMVSDLTAGLATISILALQALGVLGMASMQRPSFKVRKCLSMACLFCGDQHHDPERKIRARKGMIS